MSNPSNGGINRRQLLEAAGAAAATVAAASLAAPARAASQAAPALVPMKMTMEFPLPQPRFPIPVNPPITVGIGSTTGLDPELGSYSYSEYFVAHLGADGNMLSITDGTAAMTTASGDALYFAWSARYVPPTAPYDAQAEGTFTITGGRGRFLGATGSGVNHIARDPVKKLITCTMEGVVSAPR